MTARAPSASALTTSLPRRTPPSSKTSIWSPTASTTAGSARIDAGVPSRLFPPWFDTQIAETPASTALLASSTRITPLSMNRPPPTSRNQAMSSQVGGGVLIHSPYAAKNGGPGSPRRPWLGTRRSGGGNVLPYFHSQLGRVIASRDSRRQVR